MRACARVGPMMDRPCLAAFDTELARVLEAAFPDEPLAVGHRVAAMVAWW